MPDWADERAREIVDDIYFAATRAWSQTPQQAWDSQPHKAQIAAALRAERERGQKLADTATLVAENFRDLPGNEEPDGLVRREYKIQLDEALAAWQER